MADNIDRLIEQLLNDEPELDLSWVATADPLELATSAELLRLRAEQGDQRAAALLPLFPQPVPLADFIQGLVAAPWDEAEAAVMQIADIDHSLAWVGLFQMLPNPNPGARLAALAELAERLPLPLAWTQGLGGAFGALRMRLACVAPGVYGPAAEALVAALWAILHSEIPVLSIAEMEDEDTQAVMDLVDAVDAEDGRWEPGPIRALVPVARDWVISRLVVDAALGRVDAIDTVAALELSDELGVLLALREKGDPTTADHVQRAVRSALDALLKLERGARGRVAFLFAPGERFDDVLQEAFPEGGWRGLGDVVGADGVRRRWVQLAGGAVIEAELTAAGLILAWRLLEGAEAASVAWPVAPSDEDLPETSQDDPSPS